jgi:hypothetical protein
MSPSKEEKLSFWKAHVEEQSKSQISMSRYCRERGISLTSFRTWKKDLDPNPSAVLAKKAFVSARVDFLKSEVLQRSLPDAEWLARFILCLGRVS